MTLLLRDLRKRLRNFQGAALGHTTLMHDPGARIVDFTQPGAVVAFTDMWDQLVSLTPNRGALIASSPASVWERALTQQAVAQQDARITQMVRRRSTRGGRPWVLRHVLSGVSAASASGDWSAMTGPSRCTMSV